MVRGREVVPARSAQARAPPEPAPEPEHAKCSNSMIEFSTEAREDPNEGREFGEVPLPCVCPHCERTIITFVDYEASWVTWMLGAVVWFSLGYMSLWVLPLLWPAFKDVVHHCPRCLNAIGRKSRLNLPVFRSEVMSIKVGSCAIVLARKYVMILAGTLALIVGVYVLRSTVNLNELKASDAVVPKGPLSNLTWADYMSFCGPRTSLRQRSGAPRAFDAKFRGRNFRWQGEVISIREGFQVLFMRTRSVILVRMYPQRYPRHDTPDLALLFDEDRYDEVATLEPGGWVDFEAKMLSRGHRGDPEVMMLYYVAVATRPSPLSSSALGLKNGTATLGASVTDNSTAAAEELSGGRETVSKHTAANESSPHLPPAGGRPVALETKSEEVV